jgi:hypothetical protein
MVYQIYLTITYKAYPFRKVWKTPHSKNIVCSCPAGRCRMWLCGRACGISACQRCAGGLLLEFNLDQTDFEDRHKTMYIMMSAFGHAHHMVDHLIVACNYICNYIIPYLIQNKTASLCNPSNNKNTTAVLSGAQYQLNLVGLRGLVHTTSVRRRIALTLNGALAKFIVGPSVYLARQKFEECEQLFRQRRIRRPIRSRLCKYSPVSWIHFAITSRKKQEKSSRYMSFKDMWNDRIVLSPLLVSSFVFISAL